MREYQPIKQVGLHSCKSGFFYGFSKARFFFIDVNVKVGWLMVCYNLYYVLFQWQITCLQTLETCSFGHKGLEVVSSNTGVSWGV